MRAVAEHEGVGAVLLSPIIVQELYLAPTSPGVQQAAQGGVVIFHT